MYAEANFERESTDGSDDMDGGRLLRQDSCTLIPLNPNASISPADYEKKWTELATA